MFIRSLVALISRPCAMDIRWCATNGNAYISQQFYRTVSLAKSHILRPDTLLPTLDHYRMAKISLSLHNVSNCIRREGVVLGPDAKKKSRLSRDTLFIS